MKNLSEVKEFYFFKEQDAEAFFDKVCSTDVWRRCYTNELVAVPIDDAPILEQSIRKQLAIPDDVSTESLCENMSSLNMGLQVMFDNGYACYPLGDTAYGTLVQRAGYGYSPILFTCKEKNSQNAMAPIQKAQVINMGLSCFKNLSLVLIRDEKVRAVLSGDENDYVILPFDQLFSSFKTRLNDMFTGVSFEGATVSHTHFTAEYSFDSSIIHDLSAYFARLNVPGNSMKLSVKLISSDVGLSGANLYGYINIEKYRMMLGKPLTLTHKHKHTIVDFTMNITKIMAIFQDSTKKLEEMNQQKVKHPAGCLMRIAKQVGLPKQNACETAESIEALYGANCLQIDIFFTLYDILENYEANTPISAFKKISIEEGISRIAFSDFSAYDIPFQWE